MDYQIVWILQLVLALLCNFLDSAKAIVGRDLLLTPKQGLQLKGRSIYYEEDGIATARNNQTMRPWERALKHVTYVTLFTNAAGETAIGNISKVHAYNDFIHSPYIARNIDSDARFGDIVTLASGRLEQSGNKTFRFVEGQCDYACDSERVWALWQVQKIRHRDVNRKFRYEIKFSVSPVQVKGGANTKRRAELEAPNRYRNALQTYIQRDDDYPKTFGRIIYTDDASFADRRLDDFAGRNFRQPPTATVQDYRQATPMPQSTFMHGIFQAPPAPHFLPMPQKLNIGEYIKDYAAKATPKIELFPSILNTVSRSHYPTPTTFRPNYQVKFPRPEIYHPPQVTQHDLVKFPDHSHERFTSGADKLTTPVMHHFHHHFYMPSSTSVENDANSGEQQKLPHTANEIADVPPSYVNNYYTDQTPRQRPFSHTTHKHNFATPHRQQHYHQQDYHLPEVHEQQLVQVTPVPTLRKPQIYQMHPVQLAGKVPLLIYPAPVEEDEHQASPPPPSPSRHKPFLRSEPIDVEPVRYSEPDPLYLNLAHNPQTDENSYEVGAPQLEAPKTHYAQEQYRGSRPDSIAAQLPPPDKDQDVRIPYVDETQEASNKEKHDLEHNSSQKELRISTAETPTTEASMEVAPSATIMSARSASPTLKTATTATTITTAKPQLTVATKRHTDASTATPTTHTLHSATTAVAVTEAIETAIKDKKQHFVSTSTLETPLRAVSRYRIKYTRPSSSSTEQPVLKWKPRRKHITNSKLPQTQSADSKVKDNLRHAEKQPAVSSSAEPQPQPAASNETTLPPQSANEVFEVLTQKSVSKSVSVKVGSNGEEIPVIVDDNNADVNDTGETHDNIEQQKTANNEVKSAL